MIFLQFLIENFALILTIVALIIALKQFREARLQAESLGNIKDSLSTRFIDQFPGYTSEILSLIKKAKSKITIVCDVPGFAGLSDPGFWLEYRQELERKLTNGISVDIICYGEEKCRSIYIEQFSDAKFNWEEWKKNKDNFSKLSKYLKIKGFKDQSPNEITYIDFENLLVSDKQAIEYHFQQANIIECNVELTTFFWIADNKQAVFAFPAGGTKKQGYFTYGFTTSDPRLISALISLKQRYLNMNLNKKG